MLRQIFKRVALFHALVLAAGLALAQDYPTRAVRVVVPFSAGGVTDLMARAIALELNKQWAHPVIVENRPGAGTRIGAQYVAKSAPDGHTMLLSDPSLSSSPYLYTKLPYDPIRDFAPVLNLVQGPTVLVTRPAAQENTLREFIAAAKARPGERTYGTFGLGSSTHLTTEEFSALAGIKLNHIPYKGIADVIPALISGQIDVALSAVSPSLPLIRAGKLKVLAYAGPQRGKVLPNVPTFHEVGIPFETRGWFGLVAPAGTPRPIIDKIAIDVSRIITATDFDEKFISGAGFELVNMGPDQFAEFLVKDRAVWAARVKRVNLRLD